MEKKTYAKRKEEREADIENYTERAGKAKVPSVIAQYEKKIEKLAAELEQLESDGLAEYDYGVPYRTPKYTVLKMVLEEIE